MSAKSLETVLRQCTRALEKTSIQSPSQAQRAFSTTPANRAALVTFTETSNPDLATLLTTIRNTIFVPSQLRTAQQKLIHRTRHHALLRAEPFVVDVGDQSVTLQPLDRTKDVPDSWAVTLQALELMGTSRADWRNFVGLMAGMQAAKRKWKDWQLERVVRIAGEAGMAHEVLEGVRAAERTGLHVRGRRLFREVMWACRAQARLSGWEEEETEKALRYAEHVARLLDGRRKTAGHGDPRVQPDVIAVVLELAAMRAVRHQDGKDVDGKVLAYSQRLMANANRAVREEADEHRAVAHADYELARWVPMINALKVAQRVLGPAFPEADLAKRKLQELEDRVQRAGQVVVGAQDPKKSKRRGLAWAEELEQSA